MKYKDAGVDVELGESVTSDIKKIASATSNERVLRGVGSFGAVYRLDENQILVSSTDSVGTKTMIARLANEHRTIGEDIVNHCVNDILCQLATPLFFMDYIACGHLEKRLVTQLIEGIADACKAIGIPLVGGETAEMPGVYRAGEYDLVGFVVGRVGNEEISGEATPQEGDLLIGIPSNGFHTNGYSLVRKVVFERSGLNIGDWVDELDSTVGDALLKPHRCYYREVSRLIEKIDLHGIVHITGGGFQGNIPRVLPTGLEAVVDTRKWTPIPVFQWVQRLGEIELDEMYRTFNMGIGMVLIVRPTSLDVIEREFGELREEFHVIGELREGRRGVELIR